MFYYSSKLNFWNLKSLNRIQSSDFLGWKWQGERGNKLMGYTSYGHWIFGEGMGEEETGKMLAFMLHTTFWFTALILHWYTQGALSWVNWVS